MKFRIPKWVLILFAAMSNAHAVTPTRMCARLLAAEDVIDWVTTADPMFRSYGITKANKLDGALCVSRGVVKFLRHLGFTPSPDKTLGMVLRRAAVPLPQLARQGLTDPEMRELLRANVHWLSEDQGYDDGYSARGSADVTGSSPSAIRRSDLVRANSNKFVVLLKTHRSRHGRKRADDSKGGPAEDVRWVLLRKVVTLEDDQMIAQIEDPTLKTLITGKLLPASTSGDPSWRFEPDGGDYRAMVISALLSASLGFDED